MGWGGSHCGGGLQAWSSKVFRHMAVKHTETGTPYFGANYADLCHVICLNSGCQLALLCSWLPLQSVGLHCELVCTVAIIYC